MYGKKMSKSDGNYISPEELLEKGYTLLDIKYWFFSTHYRNFLDFTWENINAAKSARAGLRKVLSQHELKYDFNNVEKSELYKEFCDALCDDFNTSKVLSILFKAVKELDDEKLEVISYLEENVLRF
jgi:cysteinyl-tRNA synthetase